jgi:iron complex transport system ATP-binding protein
MVVAIEARGVGFRYDDANPWLFEKLDFTLRKGQTLVLLGRNGRGKTTLLKCLAGLMQPSTGHVSCAGMLGYVPQQFAAPFSYSVFDVVLMGRARHVGLFSSPTALDREHAREALALLGLSSFAHRAIGTLSGGERQLVLIARALASNADILLLDEPAAALDFHNQAIMLAMLGRLAAERGLTIVMTTHEPTHALEIGDRAVLLYGAGRCEEGAVADMCAPERLSALYSIGMQRLDHADGQSASIAARFRSVGHWPQPDAGSMKERGRRFADLDQGT